MKHTTLNVQTGEIIQKNLTSQEIEFTELSANAFQLSIAEAQAKAAQKAALLERLGITEDEARLLLA
jgi:hypothetical protein